MVLSSKHEILTSSGVGEVAEGADEALHQWSEGKSLFWSREPCDDEYVWENIICTHCYMNPVIGARHTCIEQECHVNLCETCLAKNTHEHPLVECLIPKRQYSLEQLFKSIPHLLNPENEEKIETKILWEEGVKSVGIYFSAHWCPPCRAFTPQLAELYKEFQEKSQSFRMVLLSCDRDKESFDFYRAEMPWPAVPLHFGASLKSYFQFSGKVHSEFF